MEEHWYIYILGSVMNWLLFCCNSNSMENHLSVTCVANLVLHQYDSQKMNCNVQFIFWLSYWCRFCTGHSNTTVMPYTKYFGNYIVRSYIWEQNKIFIDRKIFCEQVTGFEISNCPWGKWIVKITCPNVPFTCPQQIRHAVIQRSTAGISQVWLSSFHVSDDQMGEISNQGIAVYICSVISHYLTHWFLIRRVEWNLNKYSSS